MVLGPVSRPISYGCIVKKTLDAKVFLWSYFPDDQNEGPRTAFFFDDFQSLVVVGTCRGKQEEYGHSDMEDEQLLAETCSYY
jgi:hypothetical protein